MGGVTGDNAMYLAQVVEATQELEQLIAALSAVAHGERGTLRLRPQAVDLGELTLEASEGSGHPLPSEASRASSPRSTAWGRRRNVPRSPWATAESAAISCSSSCVASITCSRYIALSPVTPPMRSIVRANPKAADNGVRRS